MRKKKKKVKISRIIIILIVMIGLIIGIIFGTIQIINFVKSQINYSDNIELEEDLFVYKNGFLTYDDEDYKCYTGIDVSSFQNDIDWKEVKNSGIDFAILRCGFRGATDGILYEDPMFQEYAKEAREAGLDVGIYFYSSATSIDELKEEVDYINELIEDIDVTYPIAYDMEYYDNGRSNDLTLEQKTEFATYFCDAFTEEGYKTLIYGNANWLTENLDIENIYKKYDLWYAAYQNQPALGYPFTMWQYSNNGDIDGIDGSVDVNIYIERKE